MQATANETRVGMKVEIDNSPYLVVSNEFVKPGKGQAFNRIKLKNILTSRVIEKTYKSTEKLVIADVLESKMRFLYKEQNAAVFMDDETFEQVSVSFDVIKDTVQWLKEDLLYDLVLYKGDVVEVIPPTFLELKVIETAPGARGDTVSGRVLKSATVETGAKVQVPIFIEEGEMIKVDTRTGQYVSRV